MSRKLEGNDSPHTRSIFRNCRYKGHKTSKPCACSNQSVGSICCSTTCICNRSSASSCLWTHNLTSDTSEISHFHRHYVSPSLLLSLLATAGPGTTGKSASPRTCVRPRRLQLPMTRRRKEPRSSLKPGYMHFSQASEANTLEPSCISNRITTHE